MITNDEVIKNITSIQYERVVSLGHLCAPAMQLQKHGFREASYPFDWLIFSDFEPLLTLMQNASQDKDFFDYNQYSQDINQRNYYRNNKYGIRFFHDFNSYQSLEKQWGVFEEKYKRRFNRFEQAIQTPTVFIRYISNQKEMDYIEKNFEYIDLFLKSFCIENRIIYIGNYHLLTNLDIVRVGDAHNPTAIDFNFLDNNNELLSYVNSICQRSNAKLPRKSFAEKVKHKVAHLKNRCLTVYKHNKTYVGTD